MGLDRVHAQGRRRDARKRQRVLGDHHLRLAEDGVAERNVDAERASVDLAREAALGTESNAVVLHPVVLNLGVPGVRLDGEDHEVAQGLVDATVAVVVLVVVGALVPCGVHEHVGVVAVAVLDGPAVPVLVGAVDLGVGVGIAGVHLGVGVRIGVGVAGLDGWVTRASDEAQGQKGQQEHSAHHVSDGARLPSDAETRPGVDRLRHNHVGCMP